MKHQDRKRTRKLYSYGGLTQNKPGFWCVWQYFCSLRLSLFCAHNQKKVLFFISVWPRMLMMSHLNYEGFCFIYFKLTKTVVLNL